MQYGLGFYDWWKGIMRYVGARYHFDQDLGDCLRSMFKIHQNSYSDASTAVFILSAGCHQAYSRTAASKVELVIIASTYWHQCYQCFLTLLYPRKSIDEMKRPLHRPILNVP